MPNTVESQSPKVGEDALIQALGPFVHLAELAVSLAKPVPPNVHVPFEPLGTLSPTTTERLTEQALRTNERYLREFIEGSSYCPYAKQGRRAGQTSRYVYLHETSDLEPLLSLFQQVAQDPKQVVAQVIIPLIEASPEAWTKFCYDLTALGNHRCASPVLACAPLHPTLEFSDATIYSLVPLFRRAPDPTIQWVRLDGLEAIYAGRGSDNEFVDITDLQAFLTQKSPRKPPLYDVVCKTNAAMARRMTIARVVQILDEIAADGRRAYANILLGSDSP